MSTFAWLDSSDKERRQVMGVIESLRDRDTRDELGIGIIRDAIADLMFPGTTTLMTRARYFLFAPWIYTSLERRRTPSALAADRARREEVGLINALLASGEAEGVIGRDAKESLLRLPGSIYWQGLGVWGIRLFADSQSSYFRSLDTYYVLKQSAPERLGDEDVANPAAPNWHPALPTKPKDFPAGVTLALAPSEADYLRDRLRARATDSLLTWLVDNAQAEDSSATFIWEHAQSAGFTERHAEHVLHARNFSEAIQGATLLYNVMLAEKRGDDDERTEDYRDRLEQWVAQMRAARKRFAQWDRETFWGLIDSGAAVKPPTRHFVSHWLDAAVAEPERAIDDPALRTLIRNREIALKGAQARLANRRALDLWGGASGIQQLDFRWGTVQQIVNDINRGLLEAADARA